MKHFLAASALAMISFPLMTASAGQVQDARVVIDHSRGNQVEVSYRDDGHIRIGSPEETLYYLTSEGRPYVVMTNHSGDKRFALNMTEFLKQNGQGRGVEVPGEVDLGELSIDLLEQTEVVAGIEGAVVRVENGRDRWEMVVTGDKRVTGITRAIYSAEIRMAHMASQPMGAEPLAQELAIAESVGQGGILKGRLYTVSVLEEGETLEDERFALASDILVVRDWQEMMDSYH